ncbi:MAG: ABC transporter substrate-binding protein [Gemmatimonadetes bacterium]|nr:ABC transporter substrate-binding protein [Gemmatimonadota bacterium]
MTTVPDAATPRTEDPVLRFGHSPDPDDAFMFYGLAKGAVTIPSPSGAPYAVEHVLADIQTLNEMARAGELEVTAISAHAYPEVADKYWILHCGASMGIGYGPIVVARPDGPESVAALEGKTLAIPGRLTTAWLVAQLFLPEIEPEVVMFDEIPGAVAAGEVDAGLVIHEGQITYADQGLVKLVDLGEAWREETDLPLPLGLDVVRRDLGRQSAEAVARGLHDSIAYAFENEDDAVAYALDFGRGLDTERARRFVKMYVNDYTLDMGEEGARALETLFARGAGAGLIRPVEDIEWIGSSSRG